MRTIEVKTGVSLSCVSAGECAALIERGWKLERDNELALLDDAQSGEELRATRLAAVYARRGTRLVLFSYVFKADGIADIIETACGSQGKDYETTVRGLDPDELQRIALELLDIKLKEPKDGEAGE